MWHLLQALTLLFHQCSSGLLIWQQHKADMCVSALTRCHGWPHNKEHPHRNPLQRGRQQAATFKDGVHHFVLKGNEQEDEHGVEHGEPGGREAERHLEDPGEKEREVQVCKQQQSMKTTRISVHSVTVHQECVCVCVCVYVCACTCARVCVCGIALAPPGGQNQTRWNEKKFMQFMVKMSYLWIISNYTVELLLLLLLELTSTRGSSGIVVPAYLLKV